AALSLQLRYVGKWNPFSHRRWQAMQYSDDRYRLRVAFQPKGCSVPQDELTRMQRSLDGLGEAVRDFSGSELTINLIHHPRSAAYHVEARLRLPGRTLFSGDEDAYLDSAFQRCLRKLVQHVEGYKENPDTQAEEQARRRAALDRNILASQDPGDGALG